MSQTTDVSHANTVCTLPALATTSDGTLGWSTNRRKQVSFVTPTSQDVRPIKPIQKQRTFDSSEVYKAQDLSSDHHEEERRRNSGPVLGQSLRTNIVFNNHGKIKNLFCVRFLVDHSHSIKNRLVILLQSDKHFIVCVMILFFV